MKFKVIAEYHAEVELIVEGEPGTDMTDPANWGEITSEHQMDYTLYDVKSAEEAPDE